MPPKACLALAAHLSHICSWKGTSTCNFPLSMSKTTFKRVQTDGWKNGWTDGEMEGRQLKSVPNKQQHPIKRAAHCRQLLLFTPFVRTSTTKYASPTVQSPAVSSRSPSAEDTSSHMSWLSARRLIQAANCATFNGDLHSIHPSIY